MKSMIERLQGEELTEKGLSEYLTCRWEELNEHLILLNEVQKEVVKKRLLSRIKQLLQIIGGVLELQGKEIKDIKELSKLLNQGNIKDNSRIEGILEIIYNQIRRL